MVGGGRPPPCRGWGVGDPCVGWEPTLRGMGGVGDLPVEDGEWETPVWGGGVGDPSVGGGG